MGLLTKEARVEKWVSLDGAEPVIGASVCLFHLLERHKHYLFAVVRLLVIRTKRPSQLRALAWLEQLPAHCRYTSVKIIAGREQT